MKAKAISFTPDVLKAKLRALEQYGTCQTRSPLGWTLPTDPRDVPHARRGLVSGNFWFAGFRSPFGPPNQLLWVRERARVVETETGEPFISGVHDTRVRLEYADGSRSGWVLYPARLAFAYVGHCIPNGVHREGARHFLEVVEVRAERVAEISEQDALLEGVERCGPDWTFNGGLWLERTARNAYFALYDSIYGASAHVRDWCWVYTLKRATQ